MMRTQKYARMAAQRRLYFWQVIWDRSGVEPEEPPLSGSFEPPARPPRSPEDAELDEDDLRSPLCLTSTRPAGVNTHRIWSREMKFKVPDMSCNHCVKSITEAVTALDPNAHVKADLDQATVTVQTGRSADEISSALSDAGYPATQESA